MSRVARRGAALLPGLLTGAAVLLLGAAAFAWWSAGGLGAGAGTSGASGGLTVSPATPTAALYPGGRAPVRLTVTNPGNAAVHVPSLALDADAGANGFDVDAAFPDCDPSSLGYSTQDNGGTGWTVPAQGSLTITLANAMSMATDAANDCQGAGFGVYLEVSG